MPFLDNRVYVITSSSYDVVPVSPPLTRPRVGKIWRPGPWFIFGQDKAQWPNILNFTAETHRNSQDANESWRELITKKFTFQLVCFKLKLCPKKGQWNDKKQLHLF